MPGLSGPAPAPRMLGLMAPRGSVGCGGGSATTRNRGNRGSSLPLYS